MSGATEWDQNGTPASCMVSKWMKEARAQGWGKVALAADGPGV